MIKHSQEEQQQYADLRTKFVEYYNNILVPLLQQKEDFRLKCVKSFWRLVWMAIIILPMLMVLGYWLQRRYNFDSEVIFNGGFVLCAITVFILRGPFAKYRKQIKDDIMGVFVKFFDGFYYKQGQKMDRLSMEKSLIFPRYDEYEADDCFFGHYQGVGINVYEQTLKEIRQDSKGRRHRVTVFQGIVVEMDMNKNFSGQTIVLKDKGFFNRFKSFDKIEDIAVKIAVENGFAKPGQHIIITAGFPLGKKGRTNMLHTVYIPEK